MEPESSLLCEYSEKDAEATLAFHKAWDSKYIQINGLYYDRTEWTQYLRDRRRWARKDPTVNISHPEPIR